MKVFTPKLSPGKGRWPKSKKQQAKRRYLLDAATSYFEASDRNRLFRPTKATSGKVLDRDRPEFLEIAARYTPKGTEP